MVFWVYLLWSRQSCQTRLRTIILWWPEILWLRQLRMDPYLKTTTPLPSRIETSRGSWLLDLSTSWHNLRTSYGDLRIEGHQPPVLNKTKLTPVLECLVLYLLQSLQLLPLHWENAALISKQSFSTFSNTSRIRLNQLESKVFLISVLDKILVLGIIVENLTHTNDKKIMLSQCFVRKRRDGPK